MTSLEAKSVSVEFGGTEIITDIDVRLEAGEIVGLIGPNGAGKSTLLRTLCHLLTPVRGQVFLNETDIKSYPKKNVAQKIGYLSQGHTMHWPLEAEQLVTLGRLPHLSPFERISAADYEAIEQAMRKTDVLEFRTRTADTLSGGERARVMLARVLASKAQILLADEPVASLDPYHQLQVMELLKDMAGEGKLVVCVLHDLPLAARFCDRLVLLEGGRIVALGQTNDVLDPMHLQTAYHVEGIYGERDSERYVLPWRRLKRQETSDTMANRS